MTAPRAQLPLVADFSGKLYGLARSGAALTSDAKADLLTKLRAGEYVPPFQVDALTFLQTDASNANYVRFTPRGLQRMAKTFVGKPFLRDHRQNDSLARGGTILA